MTSTYAPKTFLRQTSTTLIQECVTALAPTAGVDWNSANENNVEVVYDALLELPDGQRAAIERRFEDAEELANNLGIQALIEEGRFHGLDLTTELADFPSHRDKAMWVAIHYPHVFEVASIINGANTLPQRYWKIRTGMPQHAPNKTATAIASFQNALAAYYRSTQGRGHRCTVDHYLRNDRLHYFFAYPDDYANTYVGHDDRARLVRRPQTPAFEVVFIYDPKEGSIHINAQGGKPVHEALQVIFCRTILEQELPPAKPGGHPYELNGLKSRDFGFPTDPADGIEEVRVRKLRLSVVGASKDRVTLEADSAAHKDRIYDMLTKYLNRENLPDSVVNITQATISVRWVNMGKGRQQTLTFDLTFPDSTSLKNKREELRDVVEKYLKRWGIARV
ncbi:MAG: hypothetical protein IT427_01510 [Pirellulales bacterium]|nr:hypothetical protein [Pirellulales bacterium]